MLTNIFSLIFQKQAFLEKRMAYHLQKMQENGFKREEMGKNTFDYREQDRTNSECKNIRADIAMLKVLIYVFIFKILL